MTTVETPRGLLQVLLVDDDPHAEIYTDWLKDLGCHVDLAPNLPEAKRRLRASAYQMVIVDVVFDDDVRGGDDFVIDEEDLMRGACRVILTAKRQYEIPRHSELAEMGIPMLRKSDNDCLESLKKLVQHLNVQTEEQERTPAEASVSSEMTTGEILTEETLEERIARKAREILIKWLHTKRDLNRRSIIYAGREYSPNMMIEEIKKKTEVGEAHVEMLLELFDYLTGAAK